MAILSHESRHYLEAVTGSNPVKSKRVKNGLCMIINEQDFVDEKGNTSKREGTQMDVKRINKTFTSYGCKIWEKTNRKREQIFDDLHCFVEEANRSNSYDYLVLFVLSHGQVGHNTDKDEIFDIHWQTVDLDDIIKESVLYQLDPVWKDRPQNVFLSRLAEPSVTLPSLPAMIFPQRKTQQPSLFLASI